DCDYLRAVAFLAAGFFLAGAFLAAGFLAAGFLAAGFFLAVDAFVFIATFLGALGTGAGGGGGGGGLAYIPSTIGCQVIPSCEAPTRHPSRSGVETSYVSLACPIALRLTRARFVPSSLPRKASPGMPIESIQYITYSPAG